MRIEKRYGEAWRSLKSRTSRFDGRSLGRFEDAALPKSIAVRAATRAEPAEILLYDEIGYWGITAKDFVLALAEIPAESAMRVRINSPGGDVFYGLAIMNALAARRGGVTCVVDGIAASISSVIACAGDTLEMAESSMLMIHNAWGGVVGDKRDMLAMADVMAKIDGQIAAIYAGKSGKPVDELAALMDAETWLTPSEAQAIGLCSGIVAGAGAQARLARQPTASSRHADRLRRLRIAEAEAF